ncbi:MAG: hypothetical protein N3H30_02830 [Candidatus Micrarchaeota archaeon]|nr:hypothetical protein [Candidatus Micrarchaeota archaeon]
MHKCIGCGAEYNSEDLVVLRACSKCGGTSFMFRANAVRTPAGAIDGSSDVKVLDNGIFELNIGSLAQHEPVIIEGDEGVFFIKFPKKK